ncbi:MAG: HAD family hydrolase [Duncaniella sp.]|nr:HAD family hydrolase [Muribaculum sp.]MCM1255157.1 HAD family hydrolase [Duncaniella sp.]
MTQLQVEIHSLSQLLEIDFEKYGIRGFMFDYGGTLDTKGEHWSDVILRGYKRAGLDIPYPMFWNAYVTGERDLAKRSHILPTDTFHDLLRKKIAIEFEALSAEFDIKDFREKLTGETGNHIAASLYEEARRCVRESGEMIKKISEQYPIVLVSNFYGNLNTVLEDFGIRGFFKAVIESAVVGIRKPNHEIFRLGIDALQLPASSILTVGDSLEKDILPSRLLSTATAHLIGPHS